MAKAIFPASTLVLQAAKGAPEEEELELEELDDVLLELELLELDELLELATPELEDDDELLLELEEEELVVDGLGASGGDPELLHPCKSRNPTVNITKVLLFIRATLEISLNLAKF